MDPMGGLIQKGLAGSRFCFRDGGAGCVAEIKKREKKKEKKKYKSISNSSKSP